MTWLRLLIDLLVPVSFGPAVEFNEAYDVLDDITA